MTDSNKANDLNDHPQNTDTSLDSSVAKQPDTNDTASLNIDDLDLDTLERLTNPEASNTVDNNTKDPAPNQDKSSQASLESDNSQSLAQATLAGNSYSMARSEYYKSEEQVKESSVNYDNDLAKQALSNVKDNSTSVNDSSDDFCADDIAMAVSNFDSPKKSLDTTSSSSALEQNSSDKSSLGASADLEVSNMLNDGPSAQDNLESSSTLAMSASSGASASSSASSGSDVSLGAGSGSGSESSAKSHEALASAAMDLEAGALGSDSKITSASMPASEEQSFGNSPIGYESSLESSASDNQGGELSSGSGAVGSEAAKVSEDSLDPAPAIEVPATGVMKGATMLDTSTAISGSSERVVTPVAQGSSSRTMTPEELAMIAQAGSAFSRSAAHKDNSQESVGDNANGLSIDESIAVPEKGVMKGAKMLDASTAISGISERVVTPVEQSTSSRTMTPEELALIAQAGSAFSRSNNNNNDNELSSWSDNKSSFVSDDSFEVDPSTFAGATNQPQSPNDNVLRVDESIEVPAKGVMKGAKMLDSSTAISGISERVVTPVAQGSSNRTMTPEELAMIALAGGSKPKTPIGMTPLTIEPRENDLFHQTGSSNIARDISTIHSGSTTNLFKDATVMEEGHTAIVGLDNRMVASDSPDTSTVITGMSASYIDQIQAVNEMAARQNQEHFEAKAKFEEEMAAEQAQREQELALAQQAQAQAQSFNPDGQDNYSSELDGSEQGLAHGQESYQSQEDYSLYDGIAVPDYHKSPALEPQDNQESFEGNYYDQELDDNGGNYYDDSQDVLVKNHSESSNYYDYSQYDESEVQAMPTDVPVKEDDGPNYVVGVHESLKAENNAKNSKQDDNPYSYGTYANKLAHQNAMRQNNDQEADHYSEPMAQAEPEDYSSPEETQAPAPNAPQEEAPLYYGTYASRLAQENALRNRNRDQTPPRYQSPAEFERNERKERQERAFAKNNLESNFAPEVEEHHSPEPSGMDDGALSQMNLKNSIEPVDDGPKYYMSKDKIGNKDKRDDGPVYLVGVKRNKGELNAQRSKIVHDNDLDSYEDMPTPEEEAAYLKELADAARESMAAPNSDVVKRARMLAAQPSEHSGFGSLDYEDNKDNIQGANALEGESFDKLMEQAKSNGEAPNELLATQDKREELALDSKDKLEDVGVGEAGDKEQNNLSKTELKQQQLNANLRKEEDGNYNFSNMTIKDNVGFGMMIFLYIRQLIASFFSHTTLPLFAPNISKSLGQSYPSSMPIPFFFVGLIAGAIGSILHSTIELDYVGSISYLIYLLLTGLTAYRGIHRICAFISRKWKRDSVLSSASVMVPMLLFIWLANTLIVKTDGIVEATASFAIASMLAAATASSLTWNFPQDPMDSIGNMSTKGLLFVIILSIMASFGLLHYTVGLSVFGVSIVVRLIFGYFIAKNQGTANRPYVYALQLITLFAILFDMILLKSQNYEFLSKSSLELVAYLRHYSQFF